jgi:hypothetical protein
MIHLSCYAARVVRPWYRKCTFRLRHAPSPMGKGKCNCGKGMIAIGGGPRFLGTASFLGTAFENREQSRPKQVRTGPSKLLMP